MIKTSTRDTSPVAVPKSIAARSIDVTKEFGSGATRISVLRGADFQAEFGEMTFLVGPSGCGKTTLISVLAGLLTASSGKVEVLGKSLDQLRGGRLVDFRLQNIGFIFQQFNLLPTLSAAENAAIPLLLRGQGFSSAVRQSGAMLEQLGIKEQKNKFPSQMSGGQQQRVAIARALVHDPKLVICDEPTASLDAESGQKVMNLLRELAVADDRAVIVVTHDDRIFRYADRIAHMSDGKITDVDRTTATTTDGDPS